MRTNTHTAQHPSQEWRGAAETRAQAQKLTPHTAARSGGVQAQRAHKHTHIPTPKPGVAGRIRNSSPSTHTHTAHPSLEWGGTSGARTQTPTDPKTPARSGEAQPKPEPKHTHPDHTPQPGMAGYKQSVRTKTQTAIQPSEEWRGAGETWVQAQELTPHNPARSGGVQAQRAHKHTHTPTTRPGLAGRSRDQRPSKQTQTAHPSQQWGGTSGVRTETPTSTPTAQRPRCRSELWTTGPLRPCPKVSWPPVRPVFT